MAGTEIPVLIVEDDPVMRSAFVEMLSNWGFGIRSAQNGLAALLDIRTAKPDILLSDLDMPGMNGYELLSIMRRLHPEMPLIAMSGGYAGAEVPAGVTADAFYAKGAGSCLRLRTILGEISIARLGRAGNRGRHLAFSAV
jgi:CheY-like chemotaxis protein